MAAKEKLRTNFVCSSCGATYVKWSGKCDACGEWNTIEQKAAMVAPTQSVERLGYAGAGASKLILLDDARRPEQVRFGTGLPEFDRVLGTDENPTSAPGQSGNAGTAEQPRMGFVRGSASLLGGQPGAGKSTLLLQTGCNVAHTGKVLYFSGEETEDQILGRKERLGLGRDGMLISTERDVFEIGRLLEEHRPDLVIIDSIQTMFHPDIESSPGSVAQVKNSAQYLVNRIKTLRIALVFVGHIIKDDRLAGPKTLEHMVDVTLMLSSTEDPRYRILRAEKNRYGSTSEIGVFAMTATGLKAVDNPSAIFLSRAVEDAPGSVATPLWEGSRPLMVEVQALVDQAQGNPRRVAVGMDDRRLAMLLAIFNKHSGLVVDDEPMSLREQDVYANVVGGVRADETSVYLAVLLSVASSMLGRVIPRDVIAFGEVGLIGEVRPCSNGGDRIREAAKLGFKHAVVPIGNVSRERFKDIEVYPVATLRHAMDWLNNLG